MLLESIGSNGGASQFPHWRPAKRRPRFPSWRSLMSVVGTALLAPVPFVLPFGDPASDSCYSTDVGEQLVVKLGGESTLTLNTNTRIMVRRRHANLVIRIVQGEVLVHIEHRPERLVEVWADTARIRDIGTTFDVDLRDGKVTVVVLDGALALSALGGKNPSSITLRRGQRGEVIRGDTSRPLVAQALDVGALNYAVAWEHGELMFNSTTVEEIVRQFNSYNRQPQIVIQDAALGALKMKGVYRSHEPDKFIESLQYVEPRVRALHANTPDGTIILSLEH
jgi:transmembrane sensor